MPYPTLSSSIPSLPSLLLFLRIPKQTLPQVLLSPPLSTLKFLYIYYALPPQVFTVLIYHYKYTHTHTAYSWYLISNKERFINWKERERERESASFIYLFSLLCFSFPFSSSYPLSVKERRLLRDMSSCTIDVAPEQLCYIPCNFCNIVLAVSIF